MSDQLARSGMEDAEALALLREANGQHGEAKAYIYVAGYTLEKGVAKLRALLKDERWRDCGFETLSDFADSIRFDKDVRIAAQQRKELVLLFEEAGKKEEEAQKGKRVSKRKLGKMLGADHVTIGKDAGDNSPPNSKSANGNKGAKTARGDNSPLASSGGADAKITARAERVKNQQETTSARTARVAFDAKKLGKFSLVLADPPWDDEFGASNRSIENHYETMKIEDICALPVSEIAHDRAMLFLWATPSMLEMALKTMATELRWCG